jgi:tetratricopeptide (TPR) repeat protein
MRLPPIALLAVALCFSCAPASSYYLSGTKAQKKEQKELFGLLGQKQNETGEERFVIIQKIALGLLAQKEYARLISFLTTTAQANPKDPYNAYFLFLTGYAYSLEEAAPVSAFYYHRVIKNYPDMFIRGESVHLACLKELIAIEKDPELQAGYYQEIITRFPRDIDMGETLFMLGQVYEKLGEWDLAIRTYTKFLAYPGTQIDGFPSAYQYAQKTVDFANSAKDWTFASLKELETAVRSAINARDMWRLSGYRNKVNFFAMSWAQDELDENSQVVFDLAAFMGGNQIKMEDQLDSLSNSSEAYYRTTGWTNISVWYLYFRKINFPADPEVNGRWEWAGIYYGEKIK